MTPVGSKSRRYLVAFGAGAYASPDAKTAFDMAEDAARTKLWPTIQVIDLQPTPCVRLVSYEVRR